MSYQPTKLSITGKDINASWRAKPREPEGKFALPNYQNNGLPGPKNPAPINPARPAMKPSIDPYMQPVAGGFGGPSSMGSMPYFSPQDSLPGPLSGTSMVMRHQVQWNHARPLDNISPQILNSPTNTSPQSSSPYDPYGRITSQRDAEIVDHMRKSQNIAKQPQPAEVPMGIAATPAPTGVGPVPTPQWAIDNYAKRGLDQNSLNNTWGSELAQLKAGVPEEQYNQYLKNLNSDKTRRTPREALQYWNNRPENAKPPKALAEDGRFQNWQDDLALLRETVPETQYNKYLNAIAQGRHSVPPRDALRYWMKKTAKEGVESHSANVRDRTKYGYFSQSTDEFMNEAERKAKEQVEREYGPVSSRYDASDATTKNSRLAGSMATDNDRASQKLDSYTQDDPSGSMARIYNNQPLNSGVAQRELDAAGAGFYNSLAAKEKAAKEANIAAAEKTYDDWSARRAEKYETQRRELNVQNPQKAERNLAKITAETNRMNQLASESGGQKMSIMQVVQAKINNGEISQTDGSDLLSILNSQGQESRPIATEELDKIYGNRIAASRADTASRLKARKDALDKRQQAAQQRGQSIAQHVNAGVPISTAAYMVDNPQAAQAGGGGASIEQMAYGLMNSGVEPSEAWRIAGNQYNADLAARDRRSEMAYNQGRDARSDSRADAELKFKQDQLLAAQREDAAKEERETLMGVLAANNGVIPEEGLPKHDSALMIINSSRRARGLPPAKNLKEIMGQQAAETPQPANQGSQGSTSVTGQPPAQQAPNAVGINRTTSSITQSPGWDGIPPESPRRLGIAGRVASQSGLPEQDQLAVISKATGMPLSSPADATTAIKTIYKSIVESVLNSGTENASAFKSGRKSASAALSTEQAAYAEVIKLLNTVIPPEQQEQLRKELASELNSAYGQSSSWLEWIGETLAGGSTQRIPNYTP